MTFDDILKLLNDLLAKTCDAEQGYQRSAGNCKGYSGITSFLEMQSEQRLAFAGNISEMISIFGGEPDKRACFNAEAHEAWDRLRTVADDRESVLIECKKGEKSVLKVYDRMLAKEKLPPMVRTLLINQRTQISRALAQIEAELRKTAVAKKLRATTVTQLV